MKTVKIKVTKTSKPIGYPVGKIVELSPSDIHWLRLGVGADSEHYIKDFANDFEFVDDSNVESLNEIIKEIREQNSRLIRKNGELENKLSGYENAKENESRYRYKVQALEDAISIIQRTTIQELK